MAKKKSRKTQTARAMDILKACGWLAGIVERRITFQIKHDLFGFADIVAIKPSDEWGTVALQVTSDANVSERLKKILNEPRAITCLQAGWRIEVWGLRPKPDTSGSILKARTIVYEDKNLRVIEGSLIVDA